MLLAKAQTYQTVQSSCLAEEAVPMHSVLQYLWCQMAALAIMADQPLWSWRKRGKVFQVAEPVMAGEAEVASLG